MKRMMGTQISFLIVGTQKILYEVDGEGIENVLFIVQVQTKGSVNDNTFTSFGN